MTAATHIRVFFHHGNREIQSGHNDYPIVGHNGTEEIVTKRGEHLSLTDLFTDLQGQHPDAHITFGYERSPA